MNRKSARDQSSESSSSSHKLMKGKKFQSKYSDISSDENSQQHEFLKSKQGRINNNIGLVKTEGSDFWLRFRTFQDQVRGVEKVRFEYMKELYQLDLEEFPSEEEVVTIQESVLNSTQVHTRKLKKNWNDEEKKVLVWIVGKYCGWRGLDFKNLAETDWEYIASLLNRRDSFSVKQKWLSMLKMPLLQVPWSPREDQLLLEIYEQFAAQKKSNKWSLISDELNRRMQQNIHRTGKQCRERWNNHLNPNLNRDPWSDAEDLNLLQLVLQNGKKWALISKTLSKPRNENAVKNRFNCLMKREKFKEEDLDLTSSQDVLADDLGSHDIKGIILAIQRVQWRISQSAEVMEEEEKLQDKLQELSIKQKEEANKINNSSDHTQNQNEITRQNTNNQISFVQQNYLTATSEDIMQSIPCLVNVQKGVIYVLSPEQMQDHLHQTISMQLMVPSMFDDNDRNNLIQRTLGTIEELSVPSSNNQLGMGSQASIGQYLNVSQNADNQISMGDQQYLQSQPMLQQYPNFMNIFVNRGLSYYKYQTPYFKHRTENILNPPSPVRIQQPMSHDQGGFNHRKSFRIDSLVNLVMDH